MTTEVAVRESSAAIAEQVVIKGDLSKLSEFERMTYYSAVCTSLGLNPLTRPFEFITLNGKLTLYATRSCTDQLRVLRGITITGLDPRKVDELLVVVATGRDRTGREDSSTGAVAVAGLKGEALANAMMKAETKAKRRLTLSLAGLGMTDESEVGSIPSAVPANVDLDTGEIRRPSLAERVAEKAATVTTPSPKALTKAQFVSVLDEYQIPTKYAASVRRDLFPDESSDLSDAQRGELLTALLDGMDKPQEAPTEPLGLTEEEKTAVAGGLPA